MYLKLNILYLITRIYTLIKEIKTAKLIELNNFISVCNFWKDEFRFGIYRDDGKLEALLKCIILLNYVYIYLYMYVHIGIY